MPRLMPLLLAIAACGGSGAGPGDDADAGDDVDASTGGAEALVPGRTGASGLAIDGAALFWYESSSDGAIERYDLDTGVVTELASGIGGSSQIAVLAGHVYWVNHETGLMERVAEAGGSVEPVAQEFASDLFDVASDGARLYWVIHDTVKSAAPDGTDVQTVGSWAGTRGPHDVFVDDDRVLWIADGGLWAVAKGGGTPARLGDSAPGEVSTGGGHLYTTNTDGGALLQLDADGTNANTIQDGTTQLQAVLAGDTLYWTNYADPQSTFTGSVCSWQPGGEPTVLARVPHPAAGLVVTDTDVYFTVLDPSGDGGIWTMGR